MLETNPATPALVAPPPEESYHAARDRVIRQFEMQYLLWLVNRAKGNLAEAARIAGVNRTTLYRMMVRNGIQRAPSLICLTEEGTDGFHERDVPPWTASRSTARSSTE